MGGVLIFLIAFIMGCMCMKKRREALQEELQDHERKSEKPLLGAIEGNKTYG